MPDTRKHRGPHPRDTFLFRLGAEAELRGAVADLSWLLSRDYSDRAALKLVGDRFGLKARQRTAVMRAACSDQALQRRRQGRVDSDPPAGGAVHLDGYNVLVSVEAALAGGVILHCRDSCYRDLASVHGTFRKVSETEPAIALVARTLSEIGAEAVRWVLDRPVSNSGRLRRLLLDVAGELDAGWDVTLVDSPDRELMRGDAVAATADSAILDAGIQWLNLARMTIDRHVPEAWIVDMRPPAERRRSPS